DCPSVSEFAFELIMDVKLPKLGEGIEGGAVVSVLVREGDAVAAGQTIIELENEKAVAPIPSPSAGIVTSIRVKEGDRLSVGQATSHSRKRRRPPLRRPGHPDPPGTHRHRRRGHQGRAVAGSEADRSRATCCRPGGKAESDRASAITIGWSNRSAGRFRPAPGR